MKDTLTDKRLFACLRWFSWFFLLTALAACQKERPLLPEEDASVTITNNDTTHNRVFRSGELPGWTTLLAQQQLPAAVKQALDPTDYRYYEKDQSRNQLWMVALRPGSFGWRAAKVMVSLKKHQLTLLFASYQYDTLAYQRGDFTTYSGTTRLYAGDRQLRIELFYEKGQVKQVRGCATCSLAPPPSGGGGENWCLVLPALCDYSGGGGGPDGKGYLPPDGGSGGTTTVSLVANILGLNATQTNWLKQNPARAHELYNYLQQSTQPAKQQISREHLAKMMTSATYLAFVQRHAQSGNPNMVWWEDDPWLSNSSNFNLDITRANNQYDRLTAAEKALVKTFPTQAYTIRQNIEVAFSMSDSRMGVKPGDGLNDKKDAFRHAFFQAINTRDVLPRLSPGFVSGSQIVKLFADAHESEVPAQLQLEKQMDLFNNQIGIAYCGSCVPGISSNNSIADAILIKLTNGELRYLKPLDFINYPRFNKDNPGCSVCTDGIIPGVTKLFPTNQ